MSNVLIGIIGVILFIGLALAGALFLGPRFQEASTSSQASAIASSLQQSAHAAALWKIDNGNATIIQEDTSFLVPGYLKTRIVNTAPAAKGQSDFFWQVYFNDNIYPETYADGNQVAKLVQAVIGPIGDAKAKSICDTLSKHTTGTTQATRDPVGEVGCSATNGDYIAYAYL